MNFRQWLHLEEECPVAAIRLKTGRVIKARPNEATHIAIIHANGLDAADVQSGGWVTAGKYSEGSADVQNARKKSEAARRVKADRDKIKEKKPFVKKQKKYAAMPSTMGDASFGFS